MKDQCKLNLKNKSRRHDIYQVSKLFYKKPLEGTQKNFSITKKMVNKDDTTDHRSCEGLYVGKTSPKGFSASKCDEGNMILSKC